jgi:glycosyltransferase involved in cell wall biosynthesis
VECHGHPNNPEPAFGRLVRVSRRPALRCWVTIADVLKLAHVEAGVPAEKILVLPNPADVALFARPADRGASPLAGDGPVALYAGHLYDYKGIPTILGAAALLPGVRFHLLGGWPEDVDRARIAAEQAGLANVSFHGLRPHAEVPRFLWHADVLLLPPSAKHKSAAWTSPVKLGEYLASGTPVVASAIPALRSQVKGDEVEWVEPDRPDALAAGILRVLEDPAHAAALVAQARRAASRLGYADRAARVLERSGFQPPNRS